MEKLRKSVAALAAVAAILLGGVAPANAATANVDGWVYVVVNNSACGKTNSAQVRGILGSDTTSGWTLTRWDMGDNIIYPRVRLGTSNSLSLQVRCYKWSGAVWMPVGFTTVVGKFTPTRTGQAFWVG
ncbi:hypothetical protein ACQCSX_22580 (plasmid) [Pseudarthrobacter sp. P1]|uniref:hypothetical protein n=1 Tax=Pseudarthrobacter sp. P1 TaxID=3418418 RepID=UPI003CF03307